MTRIEGCWLMIWEKFPRDGGGRQNGRCLVEGVEIMSHSADAGMAIRFEVDVSAVMNVKGVVRNENGGRRILE